MATLKDLFRRTSQNLLVLQEREAKYGGAVPLDLLNQISDHRQAIELLKTALSTGSAFTETDLAGLKKALRPLLLAGNVETLDPDTLKPEIPFLPFEPETVLIPAGPFLMGALPGADAPAWEQPRHTVALSDFKMGQYPVTNAQYAEFVKRAKYPPPRKTGWFGAAPVPKTLDHPIVGVSWFDALAYCRWLADQTGRSYRLPTEAEWEKAAAGAEGRVFPWGNTWEEGRCNCGSSQTTPVAAYSGGQSPFGCWDMLGNVWEWTGTLWGSDWQNATFGYPYRFDDGREDLAADAAVYRVFRGGSFESPSGDVHCGPRRWYAPDHKDKTRGFRVALATE